MSTTIQIRGARTHNLKNIDLTLPRDKLIVITGLSGSGKSSLAFDTLYAEGQRRYVESLSAYARQFLSIMEKPDVVHIEGLSPAISIEQKSTSHNPRSTVGTVTEIYDYLRLLFARVGEPRCPEHGITLQAQTVTQMVDSLLALPEGTRVMLLSPVIQARKGEHVQLLEQLRGQGYVRVRVNGTVCDLDSVPALSLRQKHTIEVVVDRVKIRSDLRLRLAESLENALRLSDGLVRVGWMDATIDKENKPEWIFSARFSCTECGYSLAELEPRLFSFNNPAGACPGCDGLGVKQFRSPDGELIRTEICASCQGTRLRREARHVFVANRALSDVTALPVDQALDFFMEFKLSGYRGKIAAKIRKELCERLQFLVNVGLEYLTLNRSADTLSGGEAQRIRLASQIGAGLVGVMYVLDEPSIGLHQRDNERLLATLVRLRDLGNTVIVVEHDEDAIRSADHVVDMGPGAGVHGGQVVAQGTPKDIMKSPSLTGQYLSGKRRIAIPAQRMPYNKKHVLTLSGATGNNLQNLSIDIPLGLMTCVTGVSGSGKSTLINDTLFPVAARALNGVTALASAPYQNITGLDQLDKVIDIDQSPIGRTPRSNAATYTGMFTPIRELFAGTPEARSRGYKPGRFSFNVKGGRCEACEGDGMIKVEMHFLPNMYVMCDVCKGMRYNRETLEVHYKGKNIQEILDLTIEDAHTFFEPVPAIARKLQTLLQVGLSYIKLGQSATTLSGGEAQRVKLA
ncbi:MAG: excinuclease ABC subunit UvrA, partial [Gammaproteobacteria bacterium]